MTSHPTGLVLTSDSEEQTRAIGRRIGQLLRPGCLIALNGELGSGKTRFVQGIAVGLGVPADEVASPTFVLCHIYRGRLELWHMDAYRLNSLGEAADLGMTEALENGAVVIVEWADRIAPLLPPDRLNIQIEESGPQERQISIAAHGPSSESILNQWPDVV